MKKLISYQNPEIDKYKNLRLQEFCIQFKGEIPSSEKMKLIISGIRTVSNLNRQRILRVSLYSTDEIDKYELKWLAYPYRSKTEQENVKYPDTISGVDIFKPQQPTFRQAEFKGTVTPATLPFLLTAPRILFAVATVLIGLGWAISSLKSKEVHLSSALAFPQILLIFGSLTIGLFIVREFKR